MTSMPGVVKLARLRELMKSVVCNERKGIEAYIVTGEDAHQSEYIRESDKRREFISGFKGSTGTAVITHDHALLWTDGRYFIQAGMELDPPDAWTLMKEGIPETLSIEDWLISNLPPNSIVSADPHIINNAVWTRIQKTLNPAGLHLWPSDTNLIDTVWGRERPKEVLNKIMAHPIVYSGRTSGDKVRSCFETMEKNKVTMLVLTALDEIAYLLNWRGSDIPYNPVFFAYVVLMSKLAHIFVNDSRLTDEARKQLKDEGVHFVLHPYEEIRPFLRKCATTSSRDDRAWIASTSSYALHLDLRAITTHVTVSPVSLMKLIKNPIEVQGMKQAHIRDGVALVKYFSWLDNTISNPNNKTVITEISGADQLEKFRKEQDHYVGLSFPTISSVGKHGAIIHYLPAPATDVPINNKELYLCDSGAQFLDGTTDVTRTLHFGVPTDYERECFTRVFKGQCSIATANFPSMIKGNYLDTLARKYLWDVGLDYLHGTGHGVGSYLNVHEYPTMISWRPYPDDPGVQVGMFLSNEPGYYEDGKFGIRLENIETTIQAHTKYRRADREFLTFETVTLVPVQTKMLVISMLTDDEIKFLNSYHKRCYETLAPLLRGPENAQALQWLEKETQPIQK